jgi:hypothetical protein
LQPQIAELVSSWKCGKTTAMVVLDVDQLSAITSLQRGTKVKFFVLAAETSFFFLYE